jgi:potassium efflux system protein
MAALAICRFAALMLAVVLAGPPEQAAAATASPTAASVAGTSDSAALRSELQRAREERAALEAEAARSTDPETVASLSARLRAATRLVELLAARTAGDVPPRPVPVPLSLPGAAPFAVADVDRLRDQLDDLLAQQAALRPLVAALQADREQSAQVQRKAAETLRLHRERAERAADEPQASAARDALQLARLEQRVAELTLLRDDAALAAARERLSALDAPIQTLGGRIEAARAQQRISDADLAAVRQVVGAQRARLAEWRREVDSIQADAGAAGGREALAALRELDAVLVGQESVWLQRQAVLDATVGDAASRQAALQSLQQSLAQARAHERAVGERLRLLRSELQLQGARAGIPPGAPLPALAGLQAQLAIDERLQAELARIVVLYERSLADAQLETPAHGTLGVGPWLRGWAERVWQYELFSATDTVLVEGRPVVLDYGVTVGKSIGVLLLFGLGAWMAARLSRRLIDMLVRRGAIGAPLGRVLYRWLMTLLLLAVSWVVLKMARIPLTAFAFIGGALAIGIGFAAQNLLKNLMSGAIVLFERKIRVGDIITIGAVSGTVVAVDLRSTTLRGFDGIDSILPNSHLLENLVADWSHGAGIVRTELLVPVAYGSDCAEVAQQLLACARAHDKVLADPAPEVLLAAFAADGPVFKLWIWTALQGGRAAPLVASDLLLAIDRDLRKKGISPPRTGHDVGLSGPRLDGPMAS